MEAEIRGYFEVEAKELIDRLTQGVARLQNLEGAAAQAMARAVLPDVLRAAHTLKGAAHVVGERGLAGQAHAFEDAVAGYRARPTAAGAAGLLGAVDGLAAVLAGGEGAVPASAPAGLQAGPQAGPQVGQSVAPFVEQPVQPPVEPPAVQLEPPAVQLEPPAVQPVAARSGEPVAGGTRRTMRVDVAQTTSLLQGLEESGVLLGAMRGMLTELDALAQSTVVGQSISSTGWEQTRARRDDLRRQLMDQQERLARTLRGLQATGAQLRLAPAETLLLEAARTVRATATAVGKRVVFRGQGGEERLEMGLQEALQNALLHLLRNAVAHGVEPAAERLAAGKSAEATVTVRVTRAGGVIEVGCADDGRGIALAPLRARAAELGLTMPAADETAGRGAEAGGPDVNAELLALLLQPGFARGGPVTEVSGRGVGLDAVREAMEQVGGTIHIASEPGRGTTFTLRAPQSLFGLEALEVMAGGRRFGLPRAAVEQTFRMEPHHMAQVQASGSLPMGQEMVTFVRLDDVFAARPGQLVHDAHAAVSEAAGTCVVLRIGAERLGCGVDRLLGVSDVLVRPVHPTARAAAQVAGIAMSVEGVPYLIGQPEEMLRGVRAGSFGAAASRAMDRGLEGVPRAGRGRPVWKAKPILVIDDSLTTRMLEQSILETEGYEVELANSAEQGLAMARRKEYAMFLVDVEMPGMNGFDFVALAKGDAQLQDVPAMLVTSLDSAEHRERGRAAGAVSYVVKGEFNQKLYLDRIRAVVNRQAGAPQPLSRPAEQGVDKIAERPV